MRTRIVVLAAGLVVVASAPTSGIAGTGCEGSTSSRAGATGTWTTYAPPHFSVGPSVVVAHAIDPADPRRWWATNGLEVSRSGDGGCRWAAQFVLPTAPTADVPVNRQTDRIRVLSAARGRLYAAVETAADAPHIGVTFNGDDASPAALTVVLAGEETLTATATLAVPAGRPGPLVAAASDSQRVYAVAGGIVNASVDGGRSWHLATPPAAGPATVTGSGASIDGSAYPPVSQLAVDPVLPDSLWVRSGGQVFASRDGGASYATAIDGGYDATFPLLTVAHPTGGPVRVTVVDQKTTTSPVRALRVSDDGLRYHQLAATAAGAGLVTGSGQSMTAGPARTDVVMTTSDPTGRAAGVFALAGTPARLLSVDEFGLGPLQDVLTTGTSYVFRSSTRLVRWTPDRAALQRQLPAYVPPVAVRLPPIGPGLPPLSALTRLAAPVTQVRLAPGASADVPLDLTLRPEPTPIDVFFMLDTSGSMDDVVRGLAAGFAQVARDLGQARIDAQFGLGDYQDYADVRYRRLVDISPPGEPLRRALESIRTKGGSEPAYTALDQMARGSGIPHPSEGRAVEPGQQAHWRPGSLRIVVNATDEVPTKDPDGPTRDDAIDALNAVHVRHIGVEVVRDDLPTDVSDTSRVVLGPGAVHDDLVLLSRGTGSLAPDGGVDCDGNGRIDIRAGDPLVCPLRPGGGQVELAGPLRRILSSLVDEQVVGVAVGSAADAAALSAAVTPLEDTSHVDVKLAHELRFSAHVSCAGAALGTSRLLQLRPLVGGRLGVPLPLAVDCQAPPAPPQPQRVDGAVVPEQPAVLAAALPFPPLPPAPAAAPAPAPAAAPAAMPAAAPAAAPAPGLALAPDELQAQLELAYQESQGEQLAMVDRRERSDLLAVRLLAMTAICATATGLAVRRRTATEPSVNRTTRG